MVTWSDVRSWSSSSLAAEVTALGNARDTLQGIEDELDAMVTPAGWTGDAATAAGTRRTQISTAAQSIVYEVSLVRAAVDEAEDSVRTVEDKVADIDALATSREVTVGSDGSVTDTRTPPARFDTVEDRDAYTRERQEAVDVVSQAVTEVLLLAESADTTLAAVLDSAHGDQLDSGHTDLAAAAAAGDTDGQITWPPPPDGDEQAQADWWESLTPAQRQEILDDEPDLVGNRDGIPSTARDEANRNRLDGEKTDAEEALAAAEASGDQGAIDDAQAALDSITQVEETIAQDGRYLLLLDTESGDRVKAAVANGDVDTADHVSVLTPGFTTTVDGSLASYDSRMSSLKGVTEAELDRYGHHDQTVATVSWLGYDAPQWDETLSGNSVALSGAAQRGGDDLAGFYTGINASRPVDPNLTALGHSYGSTTQGYALQQEGTGVDNTVFMSSPGISTGDLDDFDVPGDAIYYLENDNDLIADLGRFGPDPTGVDGLTHLSTYEGQTAYGEHRDGTTGHSSVFDDGSMAQHNTGLVVAGLEEHVVSERAHEFWTDPVEWPW
ncbi:alpha/beta hydrolase [Georgenia sp. Z1344]|uniref:alpha/beta hydrolase n=1 Tax=Georgenia sp. Z1344 TaxID=3416706 RepID=UPI003CE6CF07